MTIEEKAKAYDKALERTRKVHKYSSDLAEIKRMEDIFPELKESEDEKIRKRLLTDFSLLGREEWGGLKVKDICAWLEKQGEQKTYGQRAECLDCQFNYAGECKGSCSIKRNEQKPIDKVEAKFHEGEWVILAASTTLQIVKVDMNKRLYWFNDNSYLPIANEECLYHWTIQDAKDGDVLQLGEVTAIFKKYIGQEKCICYCSIDENGVFEIPIEDGEDNIYGCTNTTPATKEQRDLLFSKMKESGYEWDAEKKELKLLVTNGGDFESENCEQKSAWSYEDEANLNNIIWLCNNCIKGFETTWIPTQAKKIKHLIETIKERGLLQQNPIEWSEEDETGWTNTMIMIKECASHHYTKDSIKLVIDWLESIKQRIGE